VSVAHHYRPESAARDQEEFAARGLGETVGAVLAVADRWVAEHPDAAARLGAAAGTLVGSYLRAVRLARES
jgi:ElaB/YqjD/DUF883 family membrane-anchored ribosome-binding protein